jgi:hypothetical protein
MRYSHFLTAKTFLFLSFFSCTSLFAIDNYKNGDTVYVWAFSGLTLRQYPGLNAPKLKTIPYSTALVAIGEKFNDQDNDITVEAVPSFKGAEGICPAILISGRFVGVVFGRDTGYVFDGYLSKFPAFRYVTDKLMRGKPRFEDVGEWAKRNFSLASAFTEAYDGAGSHSKSVYRNGIVEEGWTSKSGMQRTILPNLSFEESFMIFNFMSSFEWDIRHPSDNPKDPLWSFSQKGDPFLEDSTWNFGHSACGYQMIYLKAGQLAVIIRECSC